MFEGPGSGAGGGGQLPGSFHLCISEWRSCRLCHYFAYAPSLELLCVVSVQPALAEVGEQLADVALQEVAAEVMKDAGQQPARGGGVAYGAGGAFSRAVGEGVVLESCAGASCHNNVGDNLGGREIVDHMGADVDEGADVDVRARRTVGACWMSSNTSERLGIHTQGTLPADAVGIGHYPAAHVSLRSGSAASHSYYKHRDRLPGPVPAKLGAAV